MALRQEELEVPTRPAVVYRFPSERVEAARIRTGIARRRAARRRHRAGLAVIVTAVMALTILGGGSEATAPAAGPQTQKAVVVQPGETLWDIAEEHAPEGMDLRVYVTALTEANDIDLVVAAGTRLRLP